MADENNAFDFDAFWEAHPDPKPCPFCGSQLIGLFSRVGRRRGNSFYFVKCDMCGGQSGPSDNPEVTFARWQTRNVSGDA